MSTDSDVSRLGTALSATKTNAYDHSSTFILISVCWFLASLPVVTIGPATVGAYAAIESVLEGDRIDRKRVRRVVLRQFVPSIVFGTFPMMFVVGTVFFTIEFFETVAPTAALLAVGSVYAFVFSVLVLIPTFVWLSRGDWAGTAVKKGYLWVVGHPTLAMTTGILTLGILVVTVAFTIAFVLIFGGLAFTLHLAVVPEDG